MKKNSILDEIIPYAETLLMRDLGFNPESYGEFGVIEGKFHQKTQRALYFHAFNWFQEKRYIHSHIEECLGGYRFIAMRLKDGISSHQFASKTVSGLGNVNLSCLRHLIEVAKGSNKVKKNIKRMDNEFIPYSEARELRHLGFQEPCFAYYQGSNDEPVYGQTVGGNFYPYTENVDIDDCDTAATAPLWQQAFDWLEKAHGLVKRVTPYDAGNTYLIKVVVTTKEAIVTPINPLLNSFSSRREANLACLQKMIVMIKKRKEK